jgi:transposase-like protein
MGETLLPSRGTMAGSEATKQSAARRRWPVSEKRRIVELTLRAGASVGAIAREQCVPPSSLSHWKALYRAGKLNAQPVGRARDAAPNATFLPVTLAAAAPSPRRASGGQASGSSIVQVVFASGASLRIESDALNAELLCALVAEVRR